MWIMVADEVADMVVDEVADMVVGGPGSGVGGPGLVVRGRWVRRVWGSGRAA